MIITLNKNDFKNLMETLEKNEIVEAATSVEKITIGSYRLVYEIKLSEETVQIKTPSRNIETFYNRIHKFAEKKNRIVPGEGTFSLKDVIEEEFDIKLLEVEECQ
ncbi:MAG: hypothetical protein ACRDDY_09775 [Clostridium sp.]|uniref:hypothetical protein n=1 Tax=Clostridium sp. TaxID=1506 RepID=UPI003EE47990